MFCRVLDAKSESSGELFMWGRFGDFAIQEVANLRLLIMATVIAAGVEILGGPSL